MLEPMTFPAEMSELPAMAPVRLTTSSGHEVPKPTMVSPMTNSLIPAFLAMLDETFSAYEKSDFHFDDADYARITEPVVSKIGYPMAEGTDT